MHHTTQNRRPPNLIFVLADQLRYASCGYAGDARASTPHMDRLAGEGVNFSNAVSSMPVCSAYRASLLTGKYTTSTGMVINELRMNPGHECLGHVLTRAGYQTGYIGKWHLYANQLGHHNDPRNSFVPRGPDRLGFDGFWAAYNFHHDYYNACYHTETPEKLPYGQAAYEPDAQTDMAIEFLRKTAPSGNPFALVLSVGTPHDPWVKENVPARFHDAFRDVRFPPPPNYSDTMDPYGDKWSNMAKSPAQIEEWMRVYYAMTANLDWNLGRLLQVVDQAAIADRTIVVFTSDHGEMFGAHGRMKKNTFYEEAARVPFLARWPGRIPAGHVSDACLNTVDIMPTLLSLMGLPIPGAVEGADLGYCALGQPGTEPEAALLMNTGACATWEDGHEWRALRDKRFTYAVYRVDGAELLFDNVSDPYQLRNLAAEPRQSETLNRFREMLRAQMAALGDTFERSTWYRDHWTRDRIILRSATMP